MNAAVARPPWLRPGAAVWLGQIRTYVDSIDEGGVTLKQLRRGLSPVRFRYTAAEMCFLLESDRLREFSPSSPTSPARKQ